MFTIRFNAQIAKWQVCMLKWHLIWWPIKDKEFESLDEASAWVVKSGLDQHYDEKVYKGNYYGMTQGIR